MEYYKLNDILLEMHSGGTPSTEKKEYWNGTIKWLSSGETSQNFIYDTIDKITEEGVKNSSTKLANKNDVVMACAGQGKTRGQVSYLLDDMYINQSVIALKANPKKVNSLYLYYNLSSRYDELRGGSDFSSTRGSITTATLKKLNIQLPPLPTQQKIAGILSKYDEAIENNNKRIKLLEQMAQNLYKEWFVRFRFPGWQNAEFENGIPKGWKVEKLEDFCFITDGTHDTPKQVEDGVPLVTGKAVIDRSIDFSIPYNISFEDHEKIKRRSGLETGDILFSNIGTVGNCCLVDYDREFSVKNMIILKPQSEVKSQYLFHLLINDTMQNLFKNQTNGSSQQFIGLDFMRKFKILIPSEEVLKLFAKFEIKCTRLIVKLRQQTQNLSRQRDLLLPRLMSGKLQVFRK